MEPNTLRETTNVDRDLDRASWKNMGQRFYEDVVHLFESEGQLIRTEMTEKVSEVKSASAVLITGGLLLFVGVLTLAATAVIALNLITPLWLASTIVTIAFLSIGGILFVSGKNKLEVDKIKPNRSIAAFGEIRHTLKEKVNEITKH